MSGRPTIGPVQTVRLPDTLKQRLTDYATGRNISIPAAIREILDEKLESIPILPTIWNLFPEANADDLDEWVEGDGLGGEGGEYEQGQTSWYHQYKLVRGHWVYVRADREGTDWVHTYQVTDSEAAAADVYRTAVIEAVRDWTPDQGTVWMECGYDGDIVEQLGKNGLIPVGTYTPDTY